MPRDKNKNPATGKPSDAFSDPGSPKKQPAGEDRSPERLDEDEWHLGGGDTGLEPDFGGVGTDPNYRGGSWVDQRGTRRAEPLARGGPRDSGRSDETIREEARQRLTNSRGIDAREIEVSVSRGELTLRGSVEDGDQKLTAENLVDAVPGVVEVHNLLHIRLS